MQGKSARQIIDDHLKDEQFNIEKVNIAEQDIWYASVMLSQKCRKISLVKVGLTPRGVDYLSRSSTENLKQLFLNENTIGNKGCKYLTKAKWNQLQYICLNQNQIDAFGFIHLSKGRWEKLKVIVLMGNNFGNDCAKMLTKGNYVNIRHMSLTNKFLNAAIDLRASLNATEINKLLLCQWKRLQLLWLNKINEMGLVPLPLLKRLFGEKFPNSGILLN